MPRKPTPPIQRMLTRIEIDEEGCWLLPGSGNSGYAQVSVVIRGGYSRRRSAHRISYEFFKGPIPEGLEVDHLCHTAVCELPTPCKHRRCCNPDHLEAKPHAENDARGKAPGALAVQVGMCKLGLHARTPENLITSLRKSGTMHTQCRPCWNEYQRRKYAAKRGA